MAALESSLRGDPEIESRDDNATKKRSKSNLRQHQGDRYSSASENNDEGTSRVPLNQTLESEDGTEHQHVNGLSWRSDPRKSFSDWTLQVVAVENGTKKSVTLYHAHSNVIAWGPRRGGFFVHLFQERMRQTPPSNMSRVQVSPAEAEVFPIMLDFMYCENSLPLSADRACTLYAMADKFVIPPLQKAIQKFVERYLSLTQMIEFIQYAQEQQDSHKKEIEKLVLCAVSKLCGYLVKHPLEAKLVQPSLLLHTLEQRAKFMKKLKGEDPRTYSGEWEAERSRLLSCVVAECCKEATRDDQKLLSGGYENLSREQFKQLLSHLPALESEAAMALLHIDKKLNKENAADNSSESAHSKNLISSNNENNKSMTTNAFEDQCVKVLGAQWRKGMLQKNQRDNDALIDFLQELSPRVLAKLLVKVSQQYELDVLAAEESAAATMSPKHDILSQPSRKSVTSTMVNIHEAIDSPTKKEKANHDRFCSEMTNMYNLYDDFQTPRGSQSKE
jgi:hypothetical protein